MDFRRCLDCQGSGKVMGGGMIQITCSSCLGDGEVLNGESATVKKSPKIDRRSKTYIEAINKIMDSEDCTKAEAIEIFDEEYGKLE